MTPNVYHNNLSIGGEQIDLQIVQGIDVTERVRTVEKLKQYREHLEELVEERTADIIKAKEKLHWEITEHQKAEKRIIQQNEFLSTVIESFSHPFYVIDVKDYTIEMANSAAVLGDLSKTSKCYRLIHKRNNPCKGLKDICPLEEVKKRKKLVVVEHLHHDKDGNARNIEIHAHPIFDKKGNVVQMIECCLDITERKKAEEALKSSERTLREQRMALEQKNITLREIIVQIEVEKTRTRNEIAINVNELVLPILEKLKLKGAPCEYLDLLQHHLEELTSSFGSKITKKSLRLTHREIEICSMIREGLTSKEIARLLYISSQTVAKHRKNIRKKLNISSKHINLFSFLQKDL